MGDLMQTSLMITEIYFPELDPKFQSRYSIPPRPDSKRLLNDVHKLIDEFKLAWNPYNDPKVLDSRIDWKILSTAPGAGTTRPKYAVIKKRSLLTGEQIKRIMNAMAKAIAAGCKPFITKKKERTDGAPAYHLGAIKRACASHSTPWITKDTIQPPTSDSVAAISAAESRMTAMVELCLAIDSVLNTRGQSALEAEDPKALERSRRLHDMLKAEMGHSVDCGRLLTHPVDADLMQQVSQVIRFGNLGTAVAVSQGQSEKLHIDVNDHNAMYTSIIVLGHKDDPWDSSENRGSLHLPTLGVMLPLDIGDMVFFTASDLPHRVIALRPEDVHKRTVVTTFTCQYLGKDLEHPPVFSVPYSKLN